MDAAVTLRSPTCMQTLMPAKSPPTAGGRWTGPSVPGAPHGPVPWSRRCPAVAAGCQPAGRDRRQEAAARRQADIGVTRVLAGIAEAPEVLARREAMRRPRPFGSEREPIGDGGAARERGHRVVGSRRLDDEGVGGVGDEERRVVRLLMRRISDATLPARLEQTGHHVDRLRSAAGTLETEANEVHSDQRRLRRRRVVGRRDTLVADGHPVLVDAVLGPPQPRRAGQQRCVGTGVPDGEVLRAQGAARRGAPAEGPGDLHLTGRAVRVLGEHHARRTRGAQRVAHGRSLRWLAIVNPCSPMPS